MNDKNMESAPNERATRELARAVEELPSELRNIFVMRFVQKIPRTEIAIRMGIDDAQVIDLMAKALAAVRARMDDSCLETRTPKQVTLCRQVLQRAGFDNVFIDRIAGPEVVESQTH